MGRDYNGDIQGGLDCYQGSDCCDRFGVSGIERTLYYYFDEDNLEDVEAEIRTIEASLGDKLQLIKDWLANEDIYHDVIMEEEFDQNDLSEYWDLQIGIKIRDCIQTTGKCRFETELNY
jgi:hypothetical protein